MIGTIRWWNCDQGWGFAQVEGDADVFVHFLALEDDQDLRRGQRISFDLVPGQVGSTAANVRLVNE